MRLRRKLLAEFLCLIIVGLAGYSQKADDKKETNNTATTEQLKTEESKKEENKKRERKADDEVDGVSLRNPIKIGKEARKVIVLSSVNGKCFTENTRHASVNADGSSGAKSIPTAHGTPEDLYNALTEIGVKPGENMNPDNVTTTHVERSRIGVAATWEGVRKDHDINEVIKDSSEEKIEFRFGGNLEGAKTKKTGCLACLDSCSVGIISNTAHTYGTVEKGNEVKFTGNADVLPEDGTYIAVIYTSED